MAKDKIIRCAWCGTDELYQKYHDEEWGKQVKDDATLFEFLILESAQAGLSWITILRKREGYRKAFADFDYKKIAKFTAEDVDRILQDPGVIRNRGKIESSINNAKLFMDIQKEFGSFYNYLYGFLPDGSIISNEIVNYKEAPTQTDVSDAISKDLKKRGFKFFGSTTCYAYMQAVGMVNDHVKDCSFR